MSLDLAAVAVAHQHTLKGTHDHEDSRTRPWKVQDGGLLLSKTLRWIPMIMKIRQRRQMFEATGLPLP